MPELPEVESLRLSLEPYIVGSTFESVTVRNAKIVTSHGTKRTHDKNKQAEFETILIGKKIKSLERRAKNIIINLTSGDLLLVHLKMTGQLVFESARKLISGGHPIEESENKLPHKHTYIIFKLNNGTLYYNDVRQFGYVLYYKNKKELNDKKHFDKLGLEPFDSEFTLNYFKNEIIKYKSPIKTVLLNQKVVVGCGNIYCDEVCFASGVLPMRRCDTLSESEIKLIYKNIIEIIDKAINSGGSSIANYLLADGTRGNYADYHKVYGKKGKPCPNKKCNPKKSNSNTDEILLKSTTLSGRTTVFCPTCQI
jgi:formamidopyrimidine-DNA glycosylase